MAPAAATSLDRLEILQQLGQGAMGVVLEAKDPRSGERYVVKRMRRSCDDTVALSRFQREAEVMRRLRHPNIMPILFVDAAARPPYFVMPYREGRTLDRHLADGKLDPGVAVRAARDACFGLTECHRFGIVHRDLKPSNLFLETTGRTVLLDFGLAKSVGAAEELTATGFVVGTPAYMAPEQCCGEPVTDRTDVYALGITFMELVLGKNPFEHEDVTEILRRQLEVMPRPLHAALPHKVNQELGDLVHRMIAKEPGHRPRAESCLETLAGLVRRQEIKAGGSSARKALARVEAAQATAEAIKATARRRAAELAGA